jgi:hypothetical protein
MCWVKKAIPNNRTLSLNSELKISIFSAQDPLYDNVCCINRQLYSSDIINTNYDTYHTGLFGNLKNFKTGLLLLPLHPGTQQFCLRFIMDLHKFIIH